jgi:hypothetical protein
VIISVQFDARATAQHVLRFVNWNPHPVRTFPATDPNALASLMPYYFQQHRY